MGKEPDEIDKLKTQVAFLKRVSDDASDRIEDLMEALRKIKTMADRRSAHMWDDHSDYWRIANNALRGE